MECVDADADAGQKLLQLAALRGSPTMSIAIAAFVTRCMKDSKNATDVAALNPRQIRCIRNEWRDLVQPTLTPPPVCNSNGQWELQL